ncbi:MAG: hypothetical protein CVU81_01425 [Euryarchaeota archaeon HGW-Euryarchaeota-1]|nr:MAG: hypothetical protein CVU81_01425 [Euryarchaeota archaeon HGW-Euryarchaeota-1]
MGGFRKAYYNYIIIKVYYNYIMVILPNTTDITGAFSFFTNIGVITQDSFTKTLIISVIIFVLFYLLSKIAYYVLNKYLSKATKYTRIDLDGCVFPVFASIIKNFIVFCGALVSILFFLVLLQ